MTSRNEIKLIKSLKLKKYRSKENKFLVEGQKNVKEVLHSDFKVHHLFVTEKTEAEFSRYNPEVITEKTLIEMSYFKTNTTCLAVVEMKEGNPVVDADHDVFVLDGVSDPGNLGTIIRTLDWFGYTQLVCSTDCADFYNPKTIAATMGSFTRIIPHYRDLYNYLDNEKRHVYGMVMSGESVTTLKPTDPGVFILGSESHGIRPETLNYINTPITIPGSGSAESLNVAMAATILCYQLRS